MRFVDWENRFDGFDFDHDRIFHEEIDSVTDLERESVVDDWKKLLGFKRETDTMEFVTQADSIGPFKQTGTEDRMNAKGSFEDRIRQLPVSEVSVTSVGVRLLRGRAFYKQRTHR